jgi:FixJ family two-component response regulator
MLGDKWGDRARAGTKTDPVERRPTVYVVDDEAPVRSYVTRLLGSQGYSVETFGSATELLEGPPLEGPGCLILDVCLPGLSGLDLQRMLMEKLVRLPIIFISGQGTVPMSVQAMRDGALDFLVKPLDSDALLADVQQAVALSVRACAEYAENQVLQERFRTLTPRQVEVVNLVAVGKLNKEIAVELDILEKTVKVHRGRAMHKLGVRSVAELVRLADRFGLSLAPRVRQK